jgi:hypothetical protein
MFRIGGSAGTGITSGLDQPRKELRQGTNPYDMGNFAPGTGAGFLTSFGLDLLSRPPSGNIFQTAALSARGPFRDFQSANLAAARAKAERDFLISEREKGQEFSEGQRIAGQEFTAGQSDADRKTQIDIANIRAAATQGDNDALYKVMLEQYIEDDLPPQVAERAAKFSTTMTDDLRSAVGGQRYGGVLTFDVRDPNVNKKQIKMLDGKVVYDPYEDNYKYIVIRDGEVYFDEFNSIADIQFTTPEVETEQKTKPDLPDPFSPNIEDIQGS